jgi:type II secretory pathway pseudopilin PulG
MKTSNTIQLIQEDAASSKVSLKRLKVQDGGPIVETMVVIVGLVILATSLLIQLDLDRSRAVRLLLDMNIVKEALTRAKLDMGAIPSNLTALWVRSNATSTNMYDGFDGATSWNGPYMKQQPVDASNAIKNVAISDAVTITLNREATYVPTNVDDNTWIYYLRANNVPNAVIKKALKLCTGSEDASIVNFVDVPCRATLGTDTTEYGTIDLRVDDSS